MCRPSQTPHLTMSSTWVDEAEVGTRARDGVAAAARAGRTPRAYSSWLQKEARPPVVRTGGRPLPPNRVSEIASGVVVFQGPTPARLRLPVILRIQSRF